MERNTKGRGADAVVATQRPLTEQQLSAFEKSEAAKHPMVKRIIRTLRSSWADGLEVRDELWREQDARRKENEKTKQRVLVVLHSDGWCEVYADEQVEVAKLVLRPWDSELETEWAQLMTSGQRYVFAELLQGKVKLTAYPYYLARPNQISDEALMKLTEWRKRCDLADKLGELVDLRRKAKS